MLLFFYERKDEGQHLEGEGRHTFLKKRGKRSARKNGWLHECVNVEAPISEKILDGAFYLCDEKERDEAINERKNWATHS